MEPYAGSLFAGMLLSETLWYAQHWLRDIDTAVHLKGIRIDFKSLVERVKLKRFSMEFAAGARVLK